MNYPNLALAALASGAMLLAACGREPGNETERVQDQVKENTKEMSKADDSEEWLKERDEAQKELADLRENMAERLVREEKRLADGIKDAERRQEAQAHVNELKANIARLDAQLGRVRSGDASGWQQLKNDTRTMADSTDSWFKRETERIDRKTDADADKDGH